MPARRPKRHLIRTHAKSAVLFVLTAAFVGLAAILWPHDPPVAAQTNIHEIHVFLSSTPNQRVFVAMKRDAHGGTLLKISADGTNPVSVRVFVQKDTWGTHSSECGSDPYLMTCTTPPSGLKDANFVGLPREHWIDIPAAHRVGYGAAVNAEFASVVIPLMDARVYSNKVWVRSAATALVSYHFVNKHLYSWANGASPEFDTDGDAAWSQSMLDTYTPVDESGTALDRQTQDNFQLFVAGAFIGVASAAFAAAIAEMVGTSAEESIKRSESGRSA